MGGLGGRKGKDRKGEVRREWYSLSTRLRVVKISNLSPGNQEPAKENNDLCVSQARIKVISLRQRHLLWKHVAS